MHKASKTVILLTLAHFSHHVLTALITPLLPFIRNDLGLSYTQVGVVLAAFNLSYGFGQIPAGRLADRFGSRIMLTVGIAGVGGAGVLLGLSSGYGFLIASLILMGLLGGGYHPAASPLITEAAEPENRGRALGLHVVGGSLSYFAAPLLGVAAAAVLGWRGTFLTFSLPVLLLGAYVFITCRRRSLGGASTAAEAAKKTKDALSLGLAIELSAFVLMVTTMGAVVSSTLAFLPLYLVDTYGASEKTAAALLALVYSAGVWAAPLGGRISDRFGRRRVVLAVCAAAAAALLALPRVPFGFGLAVLLLAIGAVLFARMPAAEAHIVSLVPGSLRSTVLGIYFFAGMEGSGVLTPLLGRWIDAYGFRSSFTILGLGLGAVVAVCALVLLAVSKRRERARFPG